MPTIARLGPYRVLFFSNEALEPPHVHMQHEKSLAGEPRQLECLVVENQETWLEAWDEFFGSRNSHEGS
jgi:hypothetical protein